jgi:hypothetical protein
MSTPIRTPAGTPEGGRFAPSAHAETGIILEPETTWTVTGGVLSLDDNGDYAPLNVRVVHPGDSYGLDDVLTNDGEALVEFYDARYPHTEHGQFVSRYRLSTLNGHAPGTGIDLDGGVPDWSVTGDNCDTAIAFATVEVAERPNTAASTPTVFRHYPADGCVAARKALAQIKRDKPPFAELTLEYGRTKKSDDFPDIHPPEGTVLAVTTRSGFYRLPITGGRVVVRAHSAFGDPVHISGGDVHIVTDGGDRKVSVTVDPDDAAHPPNVSIGEQDAADAADPDIRARLRIYDQQANAIITPTVRAAGSDDIPTDWRT